MRLRIIYRSYGGENMKNRPPYFGKALALQSLLRAAEAVDADILFMNDGPIPEERLSLMRDAGEVVTLPSVGMRRSYVEGLRVPARRGWSDDDLVWFSEDDYLYVPEALVLLREAATQLSVDYFALYGGTEEYPVGPDGSTPWTPDDWAPGSSAVIDGQQWERIMSTTSTFGARPGALRHDLSIFLQGLLPHKKMYRDHDTCMVYQGYQPHEWRQLGLDLLRRTSGTPRERAREALLVPFKAALNVRSHRRPANRRTLLAAVPNLATHLEIEWLSPGRDWEHVARETAIWATSRANSR